MTIFWIVLGAILILNAAMTAVWGWANLAAAFGADGIMPHLAGAGYALLILDLAALAYFGVYRRAAETRWQRFISLAMAIICLLGSIFATVTQLMGTSFGLATLAPYRATIEAIALGMMIGLTAAHAITAAAYGLLSASERAKQKSIDIRAGMLDIALAELEARMGADASAIADAMAADMRRAVLADMGFTQTLQRVGDANGPAAQAANVAPSANGRQPDFLAGHR
jgi:hypothetical protein